MFVEWFSRKMVGPFFIFSFDSSTVRAGGIAQIPTVGPQPTMAPYYTRNHDDNNAFHLTPVRLRHEAPQGGDHMPRIRKTTRQFEKDKATFFNQCKARHAVCWLCGMPIDYTAEKNTSDESYNLDHLYPVSKHAELQFDPAGFRSSHTSCNRLRGNQDPPTPIGTLSRQWITTA